MLNTLKKIVAKIFFRNLPKEITTESLAATVETVPAAEIPAKELTRFVYEPAPEAVQVVEETVIKPVQPAKKKKAPTKNKKKA